MGDRFRYFIGLVVNGFNIRAVSLLCFPVLRSDVLLFLI